MSSEARIEANRRNAQRSSGPKTPQGKAASSRNALRHGLASDRLVVFPNERQEDLDQLAQAITSEFKPHGDTETYFVERMINARWKLLRLQRLEAEAYDSIFEAEDASENPDHDIFDVLASPNNLLDKFERYTANAERAYSKALRDLQQYRLQSQKIAKQNKAKDAEDWFRNEMAKIQNEPIALYYDDPTIAPRTPFIPPLETNPTPETEGDTAPRS
jgi:hypothetical protein